MDLDEMKAVWSDLSGQLDKQKKLNQELIMQMTQEKSSSRLGRIIRMESIGVTVSLIMLCYLVMNFRELDYWPSIVGGIGLALILILGIVYGTMLITKARKINVVKNTYAEVTRHFDEFRGMLRLYKKLSIWTAVISPPLTIPLFYDLFLNKAIQDDLQGVAVGVVFTLLLTPLLLKFFFWYYSRNVSQVKEALNDMNQGD
jgi:hypothetical protein